MAKTVSYINTSPGSKGSGETQGTVANARPVHLATPPASGLTMHEVLEKIIPVVAENYADAVTQLYRGSLLTNPAFANDAEGWILSGMTEIKPSDTKNRLFLFSGASALQSNSLIRKPGKHLIYTVEEETGEEKDGTPEKAGTEGTETGSIVKGPVEWEEIKEPQQVKETKENQDVIYLQVKFICHEAGTWQISFPGSDEYSEGAFRGISLQVEASEEIQTLEGQGTWNGVGDFFMSFLSGQVEIVSLQLFDKPLDEFRKEAFSFHKQTLQNLARIFKSLVVLIEQIRYIQSQIDVLFANDEILDNLIKGLQKQVDEINQRLDKHEERITAVEKVAANALELAQKNEKTIEEVLKPDIDTLKSDVKGLKTKDEELTSSIDLIGNSVGSLQTSLEAITKRVKKIEEHLSLPSA